jgi:hypothetical protein
MKPKALPAGKMSAEHVAEAVFREAIDRPAELSIIL